MANVTIKEVDDAHLSAVAERASADGMSTQEFLRRLIAREAARPHVPDELAALAAKRRAGRVPLSMKEFNRVRRAAARSS
jgi:hypothetical protein